LYIIDIRLHLIMMVLYFNLLVHVLINVVQAIVTFFSI